MSKPILLVFQVLAHTSLVCSLLWFTSVDWAITLTLFAIMASLGLTATYHKVLVHQRWTTPRWLQVIGMLVGAWGLIGSPITWVAMHRDYHDQTPSSCGLVRWCLGMLEPTSISKAADVQGCRVAFYLHHYYEVLHVVTLVVMLAAFGLKMTMVCYLTPAALLWNAMSYVNFVCLKHRPAL